MLGIDRISCSANFFQIGGSSLLAIMLASRIQTSFGLQIPASQLFISKSITELAAFMTQSNPISRANSGSIQQPVVSNERLTATQKSQGVYCTLNQEVMILSHQLSSRPSAFSMPFAVRLSGPLDVDLLQQALQLVIPRQEVLLCHLTGKLVSKNFLGRMVRSMIMTSMVSNKVAQGLLSNALVAKMVQKRMQGKAGLGTKMVLPLVAPQVNLDCQDCAFVIGMTGLVGFAFSSMAFEWVELELSSQQDIA